jgi:hypothetical protein
MRDPLRDAIYAVVHDNPGISRYGIAMKITQGLAQLLSDGLVSGEPVTAKLSTGLSYEFKGYTVTNGSDRDATDSSRVIEVLIHAEGEWLSLKDITERLVRPWPSNLAETLIYGVKAGVFLEANTEDNTRWTIAPNTQPNTHNDDDETPLLGIRWSA